MTTTLITGCNRGIGLQLKTAQREAVLAQGIELITWTYDPLESRNAYLNIQKLGAICKLYRRNEYGDMLDELNQGMPSDRFEVEWWINSRRVSQRVDYELQEIGKPTLKEILQEKFGGL